MIRHLCFGLAAILASSGLNLAAQEALKDNYKVYVNHPSAGFMDTLNRLDNQDNFILPQEMWFPIGDADIWVIFLQSDDELQHQPDLVQTVWEQIGGDINDVTGFNLDLAEGHSVNMIFVNLAGKDDVAPDHLGCVAATTLINGRYPHLFKSRELIEANCRHYRR